MHLTFVILGSIAILLSTRILVVRKYYQGKSREIFNYIFLGVLAAGIIVLVIGLTASIWQ